MNSSIPRSALAIAVAFSLLTLSLPGTLAGPSAMLRGRVVGPDGTTPLSGVVVNLVDNKSRTAFPSEPSNERGVFEASAPVGSYSLVASTSHGAYLASSPLTLREGQNPPVSLMLKQASAAPEKGGAPAEAGAAPSSTAKKDDLAPWAKWTIVGGIVVAGLLVIDAVSEDETPASGSQF